MRFKPHNCRRLQGAADARRRARRRTIVLQVPDNKADAVSCERLPAFQKPCTVADGLNLALQQPASVSVLMRARSEIEKGCREV
jgi:hypothetical protein